MTESEQEYLWKHEELIAQAKRIIMFNLRFNEWKILFTKHDPEPISSIVARVLKGLCEKET